MKSLSQRVADALGFDESVAMNQARIECKTMLRDMISRGHAQHMAFATARTEHARTAKITALVPEVIEALEKFSTECPGDDHDHGYIVLTKLRQALPAEGNEGEV